MTGFAVIPTYNEAKHIEKVLTKLKIANKSGKLQSLVVDDGSTDKTAAIAKQLGARVLVHKKNKGKGEALKTAFKYILNNSNAKHAVVIDADMQYDPKEYKNVLLPLLKGEADFVSGTRNLYMNQVPFRHRLGIKVWRSIFNFFFKPTPKLTDTCNGFFALNRKAMKTLINNVYGGYIVDHAIRIHCIKNGLKIKEAPVHIKYNGISGIWRGIRMVLGVTIFTFQQGLRYRFGTK